MLMQQKSPMDDGVHRDCYHGRRSDGFHGNSYPSNDSGINTRSSEASVYYPMDPQLKDEISQFADEKKRLIMSDTADEETWKHAIKHKMEEELNKRVREALETPPLRHQQPQQQAQEDPESEMARLERLNAHIHLDLTQKEKEYMESAQWNAMQTKRRIRQLMSRTQYNLPPDNLQDRHRGTGSASASGYLNGDDLERLQRDAFPNYYAYTASAQDGPGSPQGSGASHIRSQDYFSLLAAKALKDFGNLTAVERFDLFFAYTKNGFREALRTGRLPDGSDVELLPNGRYRDKFGIMRDSHGPFWPPDYGPLHPAQAHKHVHACTSKSEPMTVNGVNETELRTIETQQTPYPNRWRGVQIVFDSEKSGKDCSPRQVTEGNCPSLTFESRFECGNLRQARRVGQFEYELVLKTDLYTKRHTQWYYFRVQNALPGITYRLRIINLLKKDSLYNHGMKPLVYSEKAAESQNIGWVRSGHHIHYTRNVTNLQCPLLHKERAYFMMDWQMEFAHPDDTCYLAHCYPYTFTDLKDDLDNLSADPERSKVIRREVMCETKAGNSCFLLTVTNFDIDKEGDKARKAIVVSARVHPGETNSSWMMKGLLDYITGASPTAKELRNRFIFKIVPMLNPDGVIVGNYRCSLAARDLNRNYRHPRKENFPTVWHIKSMMERLSQDNDILVYCDLHGHSRKHNVFMYGCNAGAQMSDGAATTEAYLKERLFPWLMSQKAPDKFWFRGCKFQIRRSKESTGRVVMYRQMKILNSFTMEATFCGSTICNGESRHFSMVDFQEMGKVFCEVALQYSEIDSNKTLESEVVLDLTRAILQQILESRGLLPGHLPDFTTELGREQLKAYSSDGQTSTSEQITKAFVAMVTKENKALEDAVKAGAAKDLTRMHAATIDIHSLIDVMSSETIDGCVSLLEQLDVVDSGVESNSSDSDSESDPEMTYSEPKMRRKKRKHRKKSRQGDQPPPQQQQQQQQQQREEKGLPTIRNDSESQKGKRQASAAVKYSNKNYPQFINKYEGRSNGGIPCFSEERLLARSAKKMQELRKKMEEEEQKREALYYAVIQEEEETRMHGGASMHSLHNYPFHRSRSQLEEGHLYPFVYPTVGSQSHNVRTGYTHGATSSTTESAPSVLGAGPTDAGVNQPAVPYMNTLHGAMSAQTLHTRARSQTAEALSSDSDSEADDIQPRLSIAALRTPYQNMQTVPTFGVQSSWLQPMPRRVARLPTLCNKPPAAATGVLPPPSAAPDISSIPQRRATADIMVVPSRSESSDDPHGSSAKAPGKQLLTQRRHTRADLQVQDASSASHPVLPDSSNGSLPTSLATAPMLMSREYTDLILQRLRHTKTQAAPLLLQSSSLKKPGERHSTCE